LTGEGKGGGDLRDYFTASGAWRRFRRNPLSKAVAGQPLVEGGGVQFEQVVVIFIKIEGASLADFGGVNLPLSWTT
jgi:hypothetical protein